MFPQSKLQPKRPSPNRRSQPSPNLPKSSEPEQKWEAEPYHALTTVCLGQPKERLNKGSKPGYELGGKKEGGQVQALAWWLRGSPRGTWSPEAKTPNRRTHQNLLKTRNLNKTLQHGTRGLPRLSTQESFSCRLSRLTGRSSPKAACMRLLLCESMDTVSWSLASAGSVGASSPLGGAPAAVQSSSKRWALPILPWSIVRAASELLARPLRFAVR